MLVVFNSYAMVVHLHGRQSTPYKLVDYLHLQVEKPLYNNNLTNACYFGSYPILGKHRRPKRMRLRAISHELSHSLIQTMEVDEDSDQRLYMYFLSYWLPIVYTFKCAST